MRDLHRVDGLSAGELLGDVIARQEFLVLCLEQAIAISCLISMGRKQASVSDSFQMSCSLPCRRFCKNEKRHGCYLL